MRGVSPAACSRPAAPLTLAARLGDQALQFPTLIVLGLGLHLLVDGTEEGQRPGAVQ